MNSRVLNCLSSIVLSAVLAIPLSQFTPRSHSARFGSTIPRAQAHQFVADGPEMPPFPPKATIQRLLADGPEMPPFPPKVTIQRLVSIGADRSDSSAHLNCA